MTTKPDLMVLNRVADLAKMPRRALLALWVEVYRKPAPAQIRREFLVPFLAYKIQEHAYGGVNASTRSELRRIARQFEQGDGTNRPKTRTRIRPGTKLFREWHRKTHEVLATEAGFEYAGERYDNLSEIARKITGTRWSGPAFFGLKTSSTHPR